MLKQILSDWTEISELLDKMNEKQNMAMHKFFVFIYDKIKN